jgi:hypothetical protein
VSELDDLLVDENSDTLVPAESGMADLLAVTALDTGIFAKTFFPKTARQTAPKSHAQAWEALDDPRIRKLNLIEPRGWAKTSRLRIFTAKRVAFRLSHTILYIGASEDHASRSIQWLRSQIEKNTLFAQTFGLKRGGKWNETELEILSDLDPQPVWVVGVGITGNLRGINFDDYRPDLIILDDGLTDENTATQEQRNKLADLVFGAVYESLASPVETPNAKFVQLNTPHDVDDLASRAKKDPTFVTIECSCWTEESRDLPLEQQESAWPEMKPSELLRSEKQAAIQTNRYSTWARENECRLITAERAAFRPEWLKFYDRAPTNAFTVLAIDPVPPPSEIALAKGLSKKDFEAIAVLGRSGGEYYVLDYALNRGHDPSWTVAKMFELGRKWRIARVVVEAIAYQRVLKYILEQEMQRKRIFYAINTAPMDRRKKYNRIVSSLNGIASQGRLWCSETHHEFIRQFGTYGAVQDHDDLLDAVAMGMTDLVNPYLELDESEWQAQEEREYPDLEFGGMMSP